MNTRLEVVRQSFPKDCMDCLLAHKTADTEDELTFHRSMRRALAIIKLTECPGADHQETREYVYDDGVTLTAYSCSVLKALVSSLRASEQAATEEQNEDTVEGPQ